MRVNVWIVLAILFALFVAVLYAQYQERSQICADGPSVCEE